ncbi:MAG: hypothetical protein IPH30_01955 [Betaproteobacteria bacterium]|nr:hypothetical protein [Betaproteobacteria bacterium]
MDPHIVLAKTPQGVEVLSHRGHDLPRTLRHALILVDGRSTVDELEKKGAIIPEFLAALRELITRGLVAPRSAGGMGAAKSPASRVAASPYHRSLLGLAESILGERSEKVARKIEEAGPSREELAAVVDACYKLIRLTIDEAKAEQFREAAREALSRDV